MAIEHLLFVPETRPVSVPFVVVVVVGDAGEGPASARESWYSFWSTFVSFSGSPNAADR